MCSSSLLAHWLLILVHQSSRVDGGPKAIQSSAKGESKRSFVPILQLRSKKEKAGSGSGDGGAQAGGSNVASGSNTRVARVSNVSQPAGNVENEEDEDDERDERDELDELDILDERDERNRSSES